MSSSPSPSAPPPTVLRGLEQTLLPTIPAINHRVTSGDKSPGSRSLRSQGCLENVSSLHSETGNQKELQDSDQTCRFSSGWKLLFPLSPNIGDCVNAVTTERGALRKASDIFLKGEHKQPTGFTFVFIDQEE